MFVKDLIKYLRKLEKDNGNLPVAILKPTRIGGVMVSVTEVSVIDNSGNKFIEISSDYLTKR